MWDKLEIFYHVAKAGSFTKAVDVLNITQSALSRTIFKLEDHLGHKLFFRTPKGVELTRKGEEVFKVAQQTLMGMESLKVRFNGSDDMEGKIRISTTYAIADFMLSKHLVEFKKLNKDIIFELMSNDHLIDIIQNEVDIAIRFFDPEDVETTQEHLFSIRLKLYASQSYLDKYGSPKTVRDLDNHKIITFARSLEHPYSDVDWILRVGTKRKRKPDFMANSLPSLFNAAKEGLGIIMNYEEMDILKDSGLVRVLPEIDGPENRFYLSYPEHLKEVKKIQEIRKFLLARFEHLR